jgi:hypothetical protein
MQIYTKSAIVVLLMADFYEVLSFRLSSVVPNQTVTLSVIFAFNCLNKSFSSTTAVICVAFLKRTFAPRCNLVNKVGTKNPHFYYFVA